MFEKGVVYAQVQTETEKHDRYVNPEVIGERRGGGGGGVRVEGVVAGGEQGRGGDRGRLRARRLERRWERLQDWCFACHAEHRPAINIMEMLMWKMLMMQVKWQ